MQLPDEIQDLCEAFLAGLHGILDDKLYGVYLYGALAFADGGPISDVDFHVLLNAALDDREKTALRRLHSTLAEDYPPLGAELDGYYILLEEARRTSPPRTNWRLASRTIPGPCIARTSEPGAASCCTARTPEGCIRRLPGRRWRGRSRASWRSSSGI